MQPCAGHRAIKSTGRFEGRLRHLERPGYVARQQMRHVPRETRYWLLPRGRQLIAALALLDGWDVRGVPESDLAGYNHHTLPCNALQPWMFRIHLPAEDSTVVHE